MISLLLLASLAQAGPREVRMPNLPRTAVVLPQAQAPKIPDARAQLTAAQPQGDEAGRREFYERVFSGGPPPAPEAAPEPPMEGLKSDVEALLEHLCQVRAARLGKRLEAVIAARGFPGRPALDADLLAQLPALLDVVRRIERRPPPLGLVHGLSDLMYSINVLNGRWQSRAAFAEDMKWLYGTYPL